MGVRAPVGQTTALPCQTASPAIEKRRQATPENPEAVITSSSVAESPGAHLSGENELPLHRDAAPPRRAGSSHLSLVPGTWTSARGEGPSGSRLDASH